MTTKLTEKPLLASKRSEIIEIKGRFLPSNAKFNFLKVIEKHTVFFGLGTYCKKGDRHKGKGKFIKEGVETPLRWTYIFRYITIFETESKEVLGDS